MYRSTISTEDRISNLRKLLPADIRHLQDDQYQAVAIHTNGIILDVCPACTEMFGFLREEFIGMNAWRLFTTDSVESLTTQMMNKSEMPYQVNAKHKDGHVFSVILKGKDSELAGEPIRTVWLKALSN